MFNHLLLLSERKRMFRFLNKFLHIQLGHLSIEAKKKKHQAHWQYGLMNVWKMGVDLEWKCPGVRIENTVNHSVSIVPVMTGQDTSSA